MTAPHSDWPRGLEGRFLFRCCAVEAVAVRIGWFRCLACGREEPVEACAVVGGPLAMVAAPPPAWTHLPIRELLAMARLNPELGL